MTTAAAAQQRPTIRSVSRSHVGRVRLINEDRVFDDSATGVWAVADGMGGHSGGDLAAQQVVECLRGAASGAGAGDVRAALLDAHGLIRARNQRLRLDAGATVVAASLHGDALDIVWAGDSRAYRLGPGAAEQLTRDHSVVQQLVDAGLLTPAMAEHHPQAHIVTRALGVHADPSLEVICIERATGRFLLCSDGLSRTLMPEDLARDIPLDALADSLIANAMIRDGTDNISLVLFEVG